MHRHVCVFLYHGFPEALLALSGAIYSFPDIAIYSEYGVRWAMLNPYLETWNLCSATLGSGGGVTSGAMFGGNIVPFHAARAVTVAKRRE